MKSLAMDHTKGAGDSCQVRFVFFSFGFGGKSLMVCVHRLILIIRICTYIMQLANACRVHGLALFHFFVLLIFCLVRGQLCMNLEQSTGDLHRYILMPYLQEIS